MKGLIYKQETGEIVSRLIVPAEMIELQIKEGEAFIEGEGNCRDNYINNGLILARPAQQTALSSTSIQIDTSDTITILEAPIGAACTITDVSTGLEIASGFIDGTDTFSTDNPGKYKISIILFPYLDWEGIVDAI